MMSVRPDVLPQAALDELAVLQDSVKPFARPAIGNHRRLRALSDFFDDVEDPVAAASLAQVYRAKLKGRMSTSPSRCSVRKFWTPCPRIYRLRAPGECTKA